MGSEEGCILETVTSATTGPQPESPHPFLKVRREQSVPGLQRKGLHFSLGKGQVSEDFLEEGTVVPDESI